MNYGKVVVTELHLEAQLHAKETYQKTKYPHQDYLPVVEIWCSTSQKLKTSVLMTNAHIWVEQKAQSSYSDD